MNKTRGWYEKTGWLGRGSWWSSIFAEISNNIGAGWRTGIQGEQELLPSEDAVNAEALMW